MTPIPTLDDSVHCSGGKKRYAVHECCYRKTSTPASTSFFSCTKSDEDEKEENASSMTDTRRNGPPMAAKLEDAEIMSLDRLFCPLAQQHETSCLRRRSALTAIRRTKNNGAQPIFYTDVVVIGNGPSALSLSAFLAGYRPYYDAAVKHPDPLLQEKLEIDKSKSLLEQDLSRLCEGLEGRTGHQVSLLYDYLVRPEADLGQENPSTLTWRRDEACENGGGCCQASSSSTNAPNYVPHVVLGKGAVGGTWADLAPEVMTLSFASWLELPAYSFRQWLDRDGANFATDLQMKIDATRSIVGRVPGAAVRRYYRDYVRGLGLEENVFEYALVTSVRKRGYHQEGQPDSDNGHDQHQDPEYAWDVHGCYSGGSFHLRCRWVVLATGVTVPRHLGIPGEDDPRIIHSTGQLDRAIQELLSSDIISTEHELRNHSLVNDRRSLEPVLIIGDGLSAADAVIKCLISGVPVVHSFRKTPKDSQLILSKLSKAVYPEYHTVFQLMIGATKDTLYQVFSRTQIQRVEFDQPTGGTAVLRDLKSNAAHGIRFSRVAVLIGLEADLSFLRVESNDLSAGGKLGRDNARSIDSKRNTISVNPDTCRCTAEQDLYALGPLIGDNFVRYVVGGSMAAAADIIKRKSGIDGQFDAE